MKNRELGNIGFFLVLGVALIAGVFVYAHGTVATDGDTVQASIERTPDVVITPTQTTVRSDIFVADHPFTGIGARWSGELPEDVRLSVRVQTAQGWSQWYVLPHLHDLRDAWDPAGKEYSEPLFTDESIAWQYELVALDGGTLPNLRSLTFWYFNIGTRQESSSTISDWITSLVQPASAGVTVIPRSGWGADESWRIASDGSERWPAEYATPQKLIVHHTAGSDGGSDPASVIRGIYYWHAVVLGWGDIGYNYLLDKQGNIYEGRYGGDGVVGGHTYNESKKVGYNRGSVGIAILGDYQAGVSPTAAVIASVTSLIGNLGARFGIDPTGSGFFVDQSMPNVIGHKDVDQTLCPGSTVASQLPTIRENARAIYIAGEGTDEMSATFVSQDTQPATISAGQEREVWVEFRNTGTAYWHAYAADPLTVVSAHGDSPLRASSWPSGDAAGTQSTPNIDPGQTGRFTFRVKAPTDRLEVTESFYLSSAGVKVPGSDFTLTVHVTGLAYAASMTEQTMKLASFAGTRNTITVKMRNEGTVTWSRTSTRLSLYDLGERRSVYVDNTWPLTSGGIYPAESSIAPGQTATFSFVMKSPQTPGLYYNIFRLVVDGHDAVSGEYTRIARVDTLSQAGQFTTTLVPAIRTVWRPTVNVTVKNTGMTTWSRTGLFMHVYDLGFRTSKFRDRSWVSTSGTFRMNEMTVKPGETATFRFILDAPSVGVYRQIFQLRDSRGIPITGGEYSLITRVDS